MSQILLVSVSDQTFLPGAIALSLQVSISNVTLLSKTGHTAVFWLPCGSFVQMEEGLGNITEY